MVDLLRDAQQYRARDWSIIPITHNGKPKRPALRSWMRYQTEPVAAATLRRWFGRCDVHGVAVICGPVSGGIVVRDFDRMDAYDAWVAHHTDLAATLPTVATARGRHVYFAADLDRIITLDDGELRGAGYVLLPPSKHPDGPDYQWLIPLPDGPLPRVDPVEVGLLPVGEMRNWDRRGLNENGREQKTTECHSGEQQQKNLRVVSIEELDELTIEAIEQGIMASIPEKAKTRNKMLFKLARSLKGIDALADVDPRCLRQVLKRWHRFALPTIGTVAFEESWADFLRGWGKVKHPRGVRLRQVLARAKQSETPAEVFDDPRARLLVKVCRELQADAGNDPFYLSARVAGELLALPRMTAWRYLYLLEMEGIIVATERGDKSGKATRYRYVGQNADARQVTPAMLQRMVDRITLPSRADEQRDFERRKREAIAALRASAKHAG